MSKVKGWSQKSLYEKYNLYVLITNDKHNFPTDGFLKSSDENKASPDV